MKPFVACSACSTRSNSASRDSATRRSRLTEADWRLFTTLIRFDAVYYGHFKCNLRRIVTIPTCRTISVIFIKCLAWPRP